MQKSRTKFGNRIFGLDLLRAVAISLVLIQHAGLNPFPKILLGGVGVELFFVLSGYLIGGILLRDFESFNGFSTLKQFWVRRWFRTLPLYYLALLVQVILSDSLKWEYLYYLFFLQNNFYGITLFPVSWSLVVEEWFYLSIPIIFSFLLFIRKKIILRDLLIYGLALWIFKIVYISLTELPFSGVTGNIVLRADTMLIGVIVAYLERYYKKIYGFLTGTIVITIAVLLFVIHQYAFMYYFGLETIDQSVALKFLYFPLLSLVVAISLPFLKRSFMLNTKVGNIPVFSQLVVWISILSYSFYLFHMNVFHWSAEITLLKDSFLVQVMLLSVISYTLYQLYEKPMTNLREYFHFTTK